jgi:hypothetical protein
MLQSSYSGLSAEETLPRAEEAARQALAIDDQLRRPIRRSACQALPPMGLGGAEVGQASHRAGQYATAHHWYSILLRDRGRFDEAITEARRALN